MFMSGFIVFNMIYTSVMERKKEFAIMKSFGYTQGSVSKLMLIEVLILACIGTAIGVPIGVGLEMCSCKHCLVCSLLIWCIR